MTPNELYALTPESVSRKVFDLVDCDKATSDVIELDPDTERALDSYNIQSDRMEIRWIKNFQMDYKRCWKLGTVWYEGNPVMIIQNAGRWGREYSRRIITDPALFWGLIAHIKKLIPVVPRQIESVKPDADIPNLTEFYYRKLTDDFEFLKSHGLL